MNLNIQNEAVERGTRDSDWSVFVVEGDEAEPSAISSIQEEDDKQNVARQLAENGNLM